MFDSSSNKIKLQKNIDFCNSIIKENIYENITNTNDDLYSGNTIFIERYGKYYCLNIIEYYPHNYFLPRFLIEKCKYKEYNFFYIKGIERVVKPLDLLIADYIRQSKTGQGLIDGNRSSDKLGSLRSINSPIDGVVKNIYFPKIVQQGITPEPHNEIILKHKPRFSLDSLRSSNENETCCEYDGIVIKNKAYVKKCNLYDKTYYPLMKKKLI